MQLEIQKSDEEKIEYKCQKVSSISIGSYFFDPLDNKHYLMLEPKIYGSPTAKVMDLLTNSIEALSQDFEVPCHSADDNGLLVCMKRRGLPAVHPQATHACFCSA